MSLRLSSSCTTFEEQRRSMNEAKWSNLNISESFHRLMAWTIRPNAQSNVPDVKDSESNSSHTWLHPLQNDGWWYCHIWNCVAFTCHIPKSTTKDLTDRLITATMPRIVSIVLLSVRSWNWFKEGLLCGMKNLDITGSLAWESGLAHWWWELFKYVVVIVHALTTLALSGDSCEIGLFEQLWNTYQTSSGFSDEASCRPNAERKVG